MWSNRSKRKRTCSRTIDTNFLLKRSTERNVFFFRQSCVKRCVLEVHASETKQCQSGKDTCANAHGFDENSQKPRCMKNNKGCRKAVFAYRKTQRNRSIRIRSGAAEWRLSFFAARLGFSAHGAELCPLPLTRIILVRRGMNDLAALIFSGEAGFRRVQNHIAR